MSYRESITPLATGGQWGYDLGDPGYPGSREEPADPGCPPFVYAVVTDPETNTEHNVPIAVMDFPVYEDEPDPLDQHDEGVRQEGYPQENARLCSLIPSNIRAMREALACCRRAWPKDREAAVQVLAAALADVDSIDNLRDPGLDVRTPVDLTVTNRREPDTRDAHTLAFRRARAGVLEHLARESGLPMEGHGTEAEGSTWRMTLHARTAREKGALARFLVLARHSHLTPYLRVEAGHAEDRELILGLGLGEEVFETDED